MDAKPGLRWDCGIREGFGTDVSRPGPDRRHPPPDDPPRATRPLNLCQRWLDYPIAEYNHVSSPYHPKLMDFFEAALAMRGNTPPELRTEIQVARGRWRPVFLKIHEYHSSS